MRLVERHLINRHHDLFLEIDALCFRSKNLYNLAMYHMRQEFFKTGGVFSYEQLDSLLQGTEAYKALPAKVSQQVFMQVSISWKSFFAAKIAFKETPEKFFAPPRLPGYKPKQSGRNLIIYTAQALSRPGLRAGQIIPSKTTLSIPTQQQQVHQVRIVPRVNHYVMEVVYAREAISLGLDKNNIAGMDLGVDNLAAVTSNTKGFSYFAIAKSSKAIEVSEEEPVPESPSQEPIKKEKPTPTSPPIDIQKEEVVKKADEQNNWYFIIPAVIVVITLLIYLLFIKDWTEK